MPAKADRSIERIRRYEPMLNACAAAVEAFGAQLEAFAATRERARALSDYYGSEDWYADREAWERGDLPKDLPCGVLSEDLIYDVITGSRDAAIRMLELATEILKDM